MLILSQILYKPKNFIQFGQENCVKIENINYNWSIALCYNCNQSILPCDQDKVLVQSLTGSMRVFCTFTEGYINWEHMGLAVASCWETWLVVNLFV